MALVGQRPIYVITFNTRSDAASGFPITRLGAQSLAEFFRNRAYANETMGLELSTRSERKLLSRSQLPTAAKRGQSVKPLSAHFLTTT